MQKIQAIIIDDEKRARRVLASLLNNCKESIEILCECADIPSAVEQIKNLKPDVIFLDVQMPQYAGYEIVNFFEEIFFEIIFVTAFNEYAIKAFELCAIDYLIKPIDRKKLSDAVSKLSNRMVEKANLDQYQILLETIRLVEHKKLIIPELGNRRIFNLTDLIAIEADGAYSKLHTIDEKVVMISKNLKYFEKVLPRNKNFFRSHRGWIVNLNYMEKMNRTSGILFLRKNIQAKLSRSRYAEFDAII